MREFIVPAIHVYHRIVCYTRSTYTLPILLGSPDSRQQNLSVQVDTGSADLVGSNCAHNIIFIEVDIFAVDRIHVLLLRSVFFRERQRLQSEWIDFIWPGTRRI
jgi:hypothetical protein